MSEHETGTDLAPPFAGNPKHLNNNIKDGVRAVVNGWVDEVKAAEIVEWLNDVGRNAKDPRARVNAADGVIRIIELGQRLAEHDDKERRLDEGEATESVGWQINIRTKGVGEQQARSAPTDTGDAHGDG